MNSQASTEHQVISHPNEFDEVTACGELKNIRGLAHSSRCGMEIFPS